MCFRVVFDKTVLGTLPGFSSVVNEEFPSGSVSAFQFPRLPVLAADNIKNAFTAQWGLLPGWLRDADKAKKLRSGTVNARSETVHEKASFRSSWPVRRCILPVLAFYEPHEKSDRNGKREKETWIIKRKDGGCFFLGGLYAHTPEHLLEPPGEDLFGQVEQGSYSFHSRTFSILTLEADGLLARVHNGKLRMPLIMDRSKAMEWLGRNAVEKAMLLDSSMRMDQELLEAYPAENAV